MPPPRRRKRRADAKSIFCLMDDLLRQAQALPDDLFVGVSDAVGFAAQDDGGADDCVEVVEDAVAGQALAQMHLHERTCLVVERPITVVAQQFQILSTVHAPLLAFTQDGIARNLLPRTPLRLLNYAVCCLRICLNFKRALWSCDFDVPSETPSM